MLRTSLDQPRPADPAVTRCSDDELRRMREETVSLLTAAMKQAAAHAAALTQPQDEHAALRERLQLDLAEAQARFATQEPQDAHANARFVANALRLFRGCAHKCCRRAQACRADPFGCHAKARVPEPVRAAAVRLLLAERMPWLPLVADTKAERTAYECWIAGIEAGAGMSG
ncbi:MAG: hypothetical protein QOF14_3928 [Hyphomicrobiales bacterium]|jgi:hypothetical protein|nr:hypothetical protein [Hyphomicrobiales bacterium]